MSGRVAVASWLYGLALRLASRRLPGRPEEMAALFAWQLARITGRTRRARFVVGALADVVRQAATQDARTEAGASSYGLDVLGRDLRSALRGVVRQPAFAVPIVLTLGLGIGMATAMLVVVERVLLDPLPYPEGDRMVVVHERVESGGLLPASYPNFSDWRDGARSFEAMSAVAGPQNTIVLGGSSPVRVPALFVSLDYFKVAGVAPARGRVLGPGENAPGGEAAVVVSHRFWTEVLGGVEDLDAVTLTLQDLLGRIEAYAVVGVMPSGFDLMGDADVFVPLDRGVPWSVRGNHVLRVVGRMAPGMTIAGAARELDAIQTRVRADVGDETEAVGAVAVPLREEAIGSVRMPILLLLIGALLLLATSFLNVAGALLARGVTRQKEIRVRASLGATRARLLSTLVSESVLFSFLAFMVGVAMAWLLLELLAAAAPVQIPNLAAAATAWPEVLRAAGVLAGIGLPLFGLATAVASTRSDGSALRVRAGTGTRGTRNVWRVLIAVEAAFALMLLTTAGVLGRSLWGILTAETGFDSDRVITAEVNLPPRPDGDAAMISRYFETALAEIRAIPGVEAAGLSNVLPIGGSSIAGPVRLESGETPDVVTHYRIADDGFFDALSIDLVRGRLFDQRDVPGAPHAAVINTTMARMIFGEDHPIGRRFHLGGMDPYRDDWLTVVGVVEEARPWSAPAGSFPVYYVHYRQRPVFFAFTGADFVARVRSPGVAAALRDRLSSIEADIPVRVRSLDERLAGRTADRRFVLTLLTLFAVLALLLTAVGIWGIVSFVTSRQTRDLGIRLALGATPARVLRGLQWETGPPVIAGILAGAIAATALTRFVRTQLYGVGVFDPLSLLLVAVTVAATAWAASYLPARRARRLDPVATLRDS